MLLVFVMQNLKNLDRAVLVDMLAEHTVHLTRLLYKKNRNEEYRREKLVIKQITAEIEARKTGAPYDKFELVSLVS